MNRELPPFRFLVTGMSPNYGGTESFIYGIYQHLDLTKIQFDFLNVYSTPLAKQDWLISQGASVFSLKLKRHEGLRQYRQGIIDFYQNNASRFSGIYCNVQSLDQLDMAKYAKKFGISCRVVHLHNSGYGYEPGWLTKLIIADNKLHSHRYITAYLAGSQKSISWGFSRSDQKRAILVKQGIELDRFAYSEVKREQFRSFYHLKAGKIYGSAGRFDPQKKPVVFAGSLRRN
jgi:glycosyltransferase involved in cell wall biosynthesis